MDSRFSDQSEGTRGNEEKRFKFTVNVERRCRGVDEGLTSSPTSFGAFGGERERDRLKMLMETWLESTDIAAPSSEVGVRTRGISSGVILVQLFPESSLDRGGLPTVGEGTSFTSPTSAATLPVTASFMDSFELLTVRNGSGSDSVDGERAPSRIWADLEAGGNSPLAADFGLGLGITDISVRTG